jgi:hypothetical protein
VVFAWTATGVAKLTSCQPEADSPLKVARPSSVPVLVHSEPVWALVLIAFF